MFIRSQFVVHVHVIYCSTTLQKTLHHLAVVDDDERIAPLLKTIKYVCSLIFGQAMSKVSYASQSFNLCYCFLVCDTLGNISQTPLPW